MHKILVIFSFKYGNTSYHCFLFFSLSKFLDPKKKKVSYLKKNLVSKQTQLGFQVNWNLLCFFTFLANSNSISPRGTNLEISYKFKSPSTCENGCFNPP
jgi:hypothetical protein